MSWDTWLLFTGVLPRRVVLRVRCPGPPLAPVQRCVRSVGCVACAVSWAIWLLFTRVLAPCVVLRVCCPGRLGSCSLVCSLGMLCCLCGVLGYLAPVHRCARSVRCLACAVSWATWLLFTCVLAPCVVLCVRYPGPLGSCSAVYSLNGLCRVCHVLGHLAPVHRSACSVRCVACVASRATWVLFTGVLARRVVLRVRRPAPLGSCSPVCSLGVLCYVCSDLGHLAPVHRCVRPVDGVSCAVSWGTWLLFTCVLAPCVVLCVQCPGPLGSCLPVSSLRALCCVCGVLGHLAPVHRCARWACCVVCAVSWATLLLFTGVFARWMVWRVRCRGPFGSCSPVCSLRALCCVCGVPGHLAPVHRCARWACCVACALTWATWLLVTGVFARWMVWRLRCRGPFGSCSPVCSLGVLCCVCTDLGDLAPVHRCVR